MTLMLTSDTVTPDEIREFTSWRPDGGADAIFDLREVCLLHDTPLTVEQGWLPRANGTAQVFYWCSVTCPSCDKPVTMYNEVDLLAWDWFGSYTPKLTEVRAARERDLRAATVLCFYRHIRTGWRVYDKVIAARQARKA